MSFVPCVAKVLYFISWLKHVPVLILKMQVFGRVYYVEAENSFYRLSFRQIVKNCGLIVNVNLEVFFIRTKFYKRQHLATENKASTANLNNLIQQLFSLDYSVNS